jgi:hypothetical protein
MTITLHGFGFLRNAIKFEYPFRESLESLAAATQTQILALGASEDGTEAEIERLRTHLPHLHVIPTVWDDNLRTGGLILSQQTNVALDHLRAQQKSDNTAWGLYLQADELIHERDIPQIHADFAKAQATGCDVVSFRYVHFWQTYSQIAINKKWYPEEIRGVKLASLARSWGDAQSFENYSKIYRSDVPIYHYGHVKTPAAYKNKQHYFVALHHDQDEKAKKRSLAKEERPQKAIPYYGPHPKWMKSRMGDAFDATPKPATEAVYILSASPLPQDLAARIPHKTLRVVQSTRELGSVDPGQVVVLDDNGIRGFLRKLRYPTQTPRSMESPQARPWPFDFWLALKLSEKGYGLK